jgi:hypothetical protein
MANGEVHHIKDRRSIYEGDLLLPVCVDDHRG